MLEQASVQTFKMQFMRRLYHVSREWKQPSTLEWAMSLTDSIVIKNAIECDTFDLSINGTLFCELISCCV